MEAKFNKTLAKYYEKWFFNCHDSAIYRREHGLGELTEREYLDNARVYLTIIMENWDAIEFFRIGDNAYKIDSSLPVEFRVEYSPWTIGHIKGSIDSDLDKRVEELISVRDQITKYVQQEIDFIYHEIRTREGIRERLKD